MEHGSIEAYARHHPRVSDKETLSKACTACAEPEIDFFSGSLITWENPMEQKYSKILEQEISSKVMQYRPNPEATFAKNISNLLEMNPDPAEFHMCLDKMKRLAINMQRALEEKKIVSGEQEYLMDLASRNHIN